MSTSSLTEFNLPRNAYAAFDAVSLKQLITNRLKSSGVFPDIDYEGSNINGLIDVVAYTYHLLLFYLNQTASEATFSQAELFENMNKIVSLIGYKANGNFTSSLNVTVSADSTLPAGLSYTIPRFSNLNIGNIPYSFNSDISFQKTLVDTTEYIDSIGTNHLLYQGIFKEYPVFNSMGESFELFTVNIDYSSDLSYKMVDYNNVYVFVRDVNTEKWTQWSEIGSLYLADNISTVFEKRLNEYNHIEIKFGNDINGKKLNTGDLVSLYYLESDGARGIVGNNAAKTGKLTIYNSALFNEIFDDIKETNTNYMSQNNMVTLKMDNEYAAIPPTYVESVDSIRKNAPLLFSAQNRAVTPLDYEVFVRKNFSNIVQDVKCVSNSNYVKEYLAYFYELGLERPNIDDKILFSQVSFNDACDFNNVYLFCVPRLNAIQNETTPIELFFSQKQAIIDKLQPYKMVGHNPIVNDPIYLAFDVGLPIFGEKLAYTIKDESKIRITRKDNELISKEELRGNVLNLIKAFFLQSNNTLNQILDFNQLSFDILNLNGIKSIETIRTSNGIEYKTPKLSFIYWNPLYKDTNVQATSQNQTLKFFEFPFFYQISNLVNKIEVI